jgi:hypothetical protein
MEYDLDWDLHRLIQVLRHTFQPVAAVLSCERRGRLKESTPVEGGTKEQQRQLSK